MTATRGGARSAIADNALTRLRSEVNNADLVECIPIELRRAGFDLVVFSPLAGSTTAHCVVAPICVWRTAIGVLQVGGIHQVDDLDDAVLEQLVLVAEGIGAIMERNIALERIQIMHAAAQAHSAAVESLTSLVGRVPPTRRPKSAQMCSIIH